MRAKRIGDILLLELQNARMKEACLLWDEQKEQIEEDKVKQGNDVINRDRMAADDKDSCIVLLLKEQKSVYEKKTAEH
jgi:hypothetical protein